MTIPDFLAALRETRNSWEVRRNGAIRKPIPRGELYLYPCGTHFCPVTAVFYKRTGRKVNTAQYGSAGLNIGLSQFNTDHIAATADNPARDPALYARMCEAVGVEVPQ